MFIDEAGHATEPEAVIALAGIIEPEVNTKNGSQVVLAGDPEQLGPILRSPFAIKYGLSKSFCPFRFVLILTILGAFYSQTCFMADVVET